MAATWCTGCTVAKSLYPLPGYNKRYRHVDKSRSSVKAKWGKGKLRRFINNEIRFCFAAVALIKGRRRTRSCTQTEKKRSRFGSAKLQSQSPASLPSPGSAFGFNLEPPSEFLMRCFCSRKARSSSSQQVSTLIWSGPQLIFNANVT